MVAESKPNEWRQLNNARRGTSRHFRNAREIDLDLFEINSRAKNIRDLCRGINLRTVRPISLELNS
jgi:hypothetical protein